MVDKVRFGDAICFVKGNEKERKEKRRKCVDLAKTDHPREQSQLEPLLTTHLLEVERSLLYRSPGRGVTSSGIGEGCKGLGVASASFMTL